MPLARIIRYLFGDRDAIDQMARDKSAIWYGLFFVLIAGVAREYDQESVFYRLDLFFAPLFASAPLALLYFGYLKLKHLPKGKPFGLRSYFGLFWMTAPLALLYAIPVEAMFDPLTALKLNTALLAIVASWRVWLFARVIAQTLAQPFWLILVEILWGGSIFVVLASAAFSFSLTDVMGGTVHSQETAFKAKVADTTVVTTFWLGAVLFLVQFVKGKARSRFPGQDHASPRRRAIPVILTIFAVTLLVLKQPAMYRSAKLDQLISHSETVTDGLSYMAAHQREDFARTWPLPPAARGEPLRLYRTQRMLENLTPEHPAWISEEIVAYLGAYLVQVSGNGHYRSNLLALIAQLPMTENADNMLKRHATDLEDRFYLYYAHSHFTDPEDLAQHLAVEARLRPLGIDISCEKAVVQAYEERYASGLADKTPRVSRSALFLIGSLPQTPTADQWLIEQQDSIASALSIARAEYKEENFSAASNRLAQAGIAIPPPAQTP